MKSTMNKDRVEKSVECNTSFKSAWKMYNRSKKVVKIAYSTFCRWVHKLCLSIAHFIRKGHKWTEYDYVVRNISINKRPNSTTKRKILDKLGHFCCTCGFAKCLEIHHINCNHNDTRINNLAVLCSCCHTLVHNA